MTETLHWYAETTGGVRQGDAPVHPAAVRCIFPLTCLPGR